MAAGNPTVGLTDKDSKCISASQKVNGVDENLLSEKLEGKWSIKQNIGHLAEVDEIANKRIDEILAGAEFLSPAVFEPKQDYNSMLVGEVLRYFQSTRKSNLDRYKNISSASVAKRSTHPRLKVLMSVVDLAWFDAEHDDHHLVRINEILQSLSPKTS